MRLHVLFFLLLLLFSCEEDEPDINKPTACSPSNFDDYDQYDIIAEDCFTTLIDESFDESNDLFDLGVVDNADVFIVNGSLKTENDSGLSSIRCIECQRFSVDNFQILSHRDYRRMLR